MDFIQIGADPARHRVRLPDLDVQVRRIFPLGRFLELLQSKKLGLVTPHIWDDPREDPANLCMLDGRMLVPPKGQQPLSAYLAPLWAQCWSLNPGSDTLLRAYSTVSIDPGTQRNRTRDNEGVIVTTTVRHLLSAAEAWHADGADSHFVIGRVEYMEDREIGQRIVNACNTEPHGPTFFGTVQGRAESLLWKRSYFEHEQEVRLMLIARSWPKNEAVPKVRSVRTDPNKIFLNFAFDPRLVPFERMEREAECRAAGFTGEIRLDENYQKVLHLLEMRREWPQP
jgi:hypothetical protein